MIDESAHERKHPDFLGLALPGGNFGIDAGVFEQWREALSDEDQEGFVYYGGDMGLAKFVCAFDYLSHHERSPKPVYIIQAYAAAYGLNPQSTICRVRAFEAFEHPAVQYLLESFATGNLRTAKDRAAAPYAKLLQRVLRDGEQAEKLVDAVRALDAGTRFLTLMERESRGRRKRAIVVDTGPRPVGKKTIEGSPALVDAANNAPEVEPDAE